MYRQAGRGSRPGRSGGPELQVAIYDVASGARKWAGSVPLDPPPEASVRDKFNDYARKVELAGRSAAGTTVGDIMTTQVYYVTPEHTCEQCLALMHIRRIRHLPVIDSGKVIGVLSNSDVLEELIQEDEHFISILEHDMLYLTIDTGGAY